MFISHHAEERELQSGGRHRQGFAPRVVSTPRNQSLSSTVVWDKTVKCSPVTGILDADMTTFFFLKHSSANEH